MAHGTHARDMMQNGIDGGLLESHVHRDCVSGGMRTPLDGWKNPKQLVEFFKGL